MPDWDFEKDIFLKLTKNNQKVENFTIYYMQCLAYVWIKRRRTYLMESKMSEILSAISHPNRIRILNALRKENVLCGCEILPRLGLEQSNLSRHLSTLVKAGVLIAWKDGVRMNYKVADERIFDIISMAEKISVERSNVRNSVFA